MFERTEPTATYLVSVQIGRYEKVRLAAGDVPQTAAIPARLRRAFERDIGRHGAIMTALEGFFGPYPFADYQLVVTDDELDDPIEAQGMSIFGANHVDGRRTHERLVVHELAHQWFGNSLTIADVAPHLAERGVRDLRRMAVVGGVGRAERGRVGAALARARSRPSRRTS